MSILDSINKAEERAAEMRSEAKAKARETLRQAEAEAREKGDALILEAKEASEAVLLQEVSQMRRWLKMPGLVSRRRLNLFWKG